MSRPPDEKEQGLTRQPTANPAPPPTITTGSGIDPALFQKLLQVAEREAEVRLEEINVEKQSRADAHEYAKLKVDPKIKTKDQPYLRWG